MTPAGIEPTTIRFVAQHLNHCATAVPIHTVRTVKFQSKVAQHFLHRFGIMTTSEITLKARYVHEQTHLITGKQYREWTVSLPIVTACRQMNVFS